MNRILPSKKLLVFLSVVLAISVCFILYFKFKNNKETYYFPNKQTSEATINTLSQQTLKEDSDGDGLKDWEEILWKTDLNNPDTDGDGTDDNTEILSGRNPLIAGPNDFLDKKISPLNQETAQNNNSAENKPLTQTDLLSQELFAGYVTLKQNDQLGTNQEEEFIKNLLEKHLFLTPNPIDVYTENDLKIAQNNPPDSFQKYIANLKKIAGKGDTLENDLIIVKTALETKSYQELEKLDSNIKAYTDMLEQLLAMEIPTELISFHLKITNTFNNMIQNVSEMRLIMDDPITGIKGAQDYFNNGKILTKELSSIN